MLSTCDCTPPPFPNCCCCWSTNRAGVPVQVHPQYHVHRIGTHPPQSSFIWKPCVITTLLHPRTRCTHGATSASATLSSLQPPLPCPHHWHEITGPEIIKIRQPRGKTAATFQHSAKLPPGPPPRPLTPQVHSAKFADGGCICRTWAGGLDVKIRPDSCSYKMLLVALKL